MRRVHDKAKNACLQSLKEENTHLCSVKMSMAERIEKMAALLFSHGLRLE
jgi:hypothetical protein